MFPERFPEGVDRQCCENTPAYKPSHHRLVAFYFELYVGICFIAQACLELDPPALPLGVLGLQACAVMLMNTNGHVRVLACMSDFSVAVIKNIMMTSNIRSVYMDSWFHRHKSP